MTPDRWRKVEEIYHSVLAKPTEEREALLSAACNGDDGLRREVEELLRRSDSAEGFLDRPLWSPAERPDPQPGEELGPYRITQFIGAGGMGKVYKALDTRLGRTVAIKISRDEFSGRFRREARAVAAINHPNICTLYDIGPNYLVMEHVEGAPLRGPMPLGEVLKVGAAIAGALDAAHRKGIIHRDLKPANILLTEAGPKLLDFGLAKIDAGSAAAAPDTVSLTGTRAAPIAGTMQYMAPEQLQGRPADARSDIFSLGLVLFEMLTGRPAFEADNSASLIAAILTAQPSLRNYVPLAPPAVERLIDKALAKAPENRWQSAREMKAELEWIASTPMERQPAAAAAGGPRHSNAAAWWAAAAICILALAAWIFGPSRPEGPAREIVTRVTASRAVKLTWFDRSGAILGTVGEPADYSNPALSPDGGRLAVSIADRNGRRDIWIYDLVLGGRTQFTSDPSDESNPVWSPDGSEILYFSDREGTRELYTRASSGQGPEQRIDAERGANKSPLDWFGPDRTIVYNVARNDLSSGYDLWTLPLVGGPQEPKSLMHSQARRDWAAVSPDGRWILYRSGSHDESNLHLQRMPPDSREWTLAVSPTQEGHWKADSREFYYITGNSMIARRISADNRDVEAADTLFRVAAGPFTGRNAFVVSPDGRRFLVITR